ncbi:MAG: D-glycero-beta-D-manno-heptose-7-phosphate kinase [Candidatus Omnitrophica bacterium CG11_big_fil_rev_8_21_14_0_20_63_9]|nr:MAG: D-glycero-beta-D-manno-heptose-7-phosphate kinase [Candidatus Omnitrophica bacterium CG11_big_fil_rev_8_21_14_0_20_63_9]
MTHASANSLPSFIPRFKRARVLVIGDLMLDEFIWGRVSRISPEAPVPVVWVQSESVMPGGAANVANNIRALSGQVSVIGAVGEDRWGHALLEDLASRKIDTSGVLKIRRPTTVKTRVIAHHQQVVRVDREQREPLPASLVDRLIEQVKKHLTRVDALVIEDYGKGVITRPLLEAILPLARQRGKIITVDPKQEHFDLYQRVTALTPNRSEAGEAVGRELESNADVRRAGLEILQRLEADGLLITLGEDGMALFEQGGRQTIIPTVAQEVFDVAGAGDTVIATFTLALASGASMEQAARLANYAAGIVVGKLGVATAGPEELSATLRSRRGVVAPRRSARRA